MDFYTLLIILHVAGTILGVGGATIAEVNIMTALKDGKVDKSEGALMHANYKMIRVGTAIVLISGILMIWWLYNSGAESILMDQKLWFKDTLLILIILNAFLISKRLVPLWLGAAISFTSWWTATILGLWKDQPYNYLELAIGFVIAVFVVAGILELIRKKVTAEKPARKPAK